MAETSLIEWTDATWNPITGCSIVSPGCARCYAMKLAGGRMAHHWSREGLTEPSKTGPVWNGVVRFNEEWLTLPLRWKRPRRIFVCAHGDLFHESVPDAWIDKVFAVMALAPHHTFQVLTKRAARMRAWLTADRRFEICGAVDALFPMRTDRSRTARDRIARLTAPGMMAPLENVWLGVSAEDQVRADERIPELLQTPAAVRFLSAEPLLGPIDLDCPDVDWAKFPAGNGLAPLPPYGDGRLRLDWVIAGGESGAGARPMHPDWARRLRDDCARAGVPFFFKQWGEFAPDTGPPPKPRLDPPLPIAVWRGDRWEWHEVVTGLVGADQDDYLLRYGKKVAGRELDGRTHDGMPGPRA